MKIFKGTQIKLTSEIMSKIKAHTDEALSHYYNPNNRSINTIKEHVTRGKMAEYGYYLMAKEQRIPISEPDLQDHRNGDDGGYDFVVNDVTVDVKSLDANKRGHSQVPIAEHLRAEAYVLCWVDMYYKTVTYAGAITREKIRKYNLLEEGKNSVTGKRYTYVSKNHLTELNEDFE